MKWLGLLVGLAIGCGEAPDNSVIQKADAATAVDPMDGQSLGWKVEELEREASRILDAIFLTEWPNVQSQLTPELAASGKELKGQLAEIDREIASILPQFSAQRDKKEAAREAAVWRQRVASANAIVTSAAPVLGEVEAAAKKVIVENNASGVSQSTIDAANQEALDSVRDAQEDLAQARLTLLKARRMLRLYE